MGPTWGSSGAKGTQVGAMLAPWTLLSGLGSKRDTHSLWPGFEYLSRYTSVVGFLIVSVNLSYQSSSASLHIMTDVVKHLHTCTFSYYITVCHISLLGSLYVIYGYLSHYVFMKQLLCCHTYRKIISTLGYRFTLIYIAIASSEPLDFWSVVVAWFIN